MIDPNILDVNGCFDHLKAQRNASLDEAAMLAGMVTARDRKIAELEAEVASLKKEDTAVVSEAMKLPTKADG